MRRPTLAPEACDTAAEQAAYFADVDATIDAQLADYDDTATDLGSCGSGACIHAEWDLPCPPDPWAENDVVTCPRCETDHAHRPGDGRCTDCGYQIREDGL